MKHPFEWIKESSRKYIFWLLFILTLVVMFAIKVTGKPLITESAPGGIVSFELAGRLPIAKTILESWGMTAKIYAGLNLGLDYLFLFLYAITIGLGVVMIADRIKKIRFAYITGIVISWLVLLGGLLDAVENFALIKLLLGSLNETLPVLARWCAIFKFLFVAIGMIYLILGGLFSLFLKREPQ